MAHFDSLPRLKPSKQRTKHAHATSRIVIHFPMDLDAAVQLQLYEENSLTAPSFSFRENTRFYPMKEDFIATLKQANGRSEFVIVVFADIRGFSAFSIVNESPNIAMFIKRFYSRLIVDYFPTANFFKPTGDGLLMTFSYTETSLMEVTETVFSSIFKCLREFPSLCKGDPMINFPVPNAIGFGVARGTACCLFSGDEIIDYSGHLLNLASRLTDLARPAGIIIDGSFFLTTLPKRLRSRFEECNIFLRSLAEEKSITAYKLKSVTIPKVNLRQMRHEEWQKAEKKLVASQLLKFDSYYRFELPTPAKDQNLVVVKLIHSDIKNKGFDLEHTLSSWSYEEEEGSKAAIIVDITESKSLLTKHGFRPRESITITCAWIPR